jgi:mannosyltransferase
MRVNSRRLRDITLLALGSGLFVFAALVSNAGIERALLGQATGALSWGPGLFRILLAAHGLVLAFFGLRGVRRPEVASTAAPAVGTSQGTPQKWGWISWGILSVLCAIALALRLWHLNSCLWFDEVITLLDFVRPPLGTIVTSFQSQNQHMLYSILAHATVHWFGESAWALRLPAVGFGVGSIWALFLLGRSLAGRLEALLACALMTVSYHHIWFSQDARGYTGLLFFATLATWLWLEALRRKTWRLWILYGVVCALGLWVHLTMIFVPAAHGLSYLVQLMRPAWIVPSGPSQASEVAGRWKPFAAWLLCGSLTLQLYALSLPGFFHTALHEGVETHTEWTNPLWVLHATLRGLQVGWSGTAVVFLGALLALLGWFSILRRDRHAALALVLPGILGGSSMLLLSHPLWPRFFFFSLGFALLIVVRGAMAFPGVVLAPVRSLESSEGLRTNLGLVVAFLMILASVATLPRGYAFPKQDFTGARDYVRRNLQHGDAVVAVGLAGVAYSRYFAPHWLAAQTSEELEAVQRGHSRVWLIYTIPIQLQAQNYEFWQMIERQYRVVKVFAGTLGGGNIYVCRERMKEVVLGPRRPGPSGGRRGLRRVSGQMGLN